VESQFISACNSYIYSQWAWATWPRAARATAATAVFMIGMMKERIDCFSECSECWRCSCWIRDDSSWLYVFVLQAGNLKRPLRLDCHVPDIRRQRKLPIVIGPSMSVEMKRTSCRWQYGVALSVIEPDHEADSCVISAGGCFSMHSESRQRQRG
jgi:hypothetical protein